MAVKPPFRVAQSRIRLGTDGRASVPTNSGQLLYLETAAPTAAVHGNPGFEDQTAGVPDVWDLFWVTGSPVVSSEETVVYSGDRSLKVHIPAGGGEQVVMSDVFDVEPGGTVDFGGFACKDEGDPTIALGLLTGASGTPVFLEPADYTNNENSPLPLTEGWRMPQRIATVPGGHVKARMFYRIAPAATEAVTVYLDLTFSELRSAPDVDSGWIPVPFEAHWSDLGGDWQPCEYRHLGDYLELRGVAARGVSAGDTLAELPEGFRPLATNPISSVLHVTSAGLLVNANPESVLPLTGRVSML